MSETTEQRELEATMPGLETTWRTLAVVGGLIAVLGLLAVVYPAFSSASLTILFGAIVVVSGVGHIVHAFSAQGWGGFLWEAILAVVYIVAGIALLANPVLGLVTLTLLLIAYFLASGIVEIVMGYRVRASEPRWVWVVASGAVSLVLAALLWLGFPSTAAWALGLLVGVHLLVTGISMVGLALSARSAVSAAPAGRAPETG